MGDANKALKLSKAHFSPIYGRSVVQSQQILQTAHDTRQL